MFPIPTTSCDGTQSHPFIGMRKGSQLRPTRYSMSGTNGPDTAGSRRAQRIIASDEALRIQAIPDSRLYSESPEEMVERRQGGDSGTERNRKSDVRGTCRLPSIPHLLTSTQAFYHVRRKSKRVSSFTPLRVLITSKFLEPPLFRRTLRFTRKPLSVSQQTRMQFGTSGNSSLPHSLFFPALQLFRGKVRHCGQVARDG